MTVKIFHYYKYILNSYDFLNACEILREIFTNVTNFAWNYIKIYSYSLKKFLRYQLKIKFLKTLQNSYKYLQNSYKTIALLKFLKIASENSYYNLTKLLKLDKQLQNFYESL